jgi:hypothetical protein
MFAVKLGNIKALSSLRNAASEFPALHSSTTYSLMNKLYLCRSFSQKIRVAVCRFALRISLLVRAVA